MSQSQIATRVRCESEIDRLRVRMNFPRWVADALKRKLPPLEVSAKRSGPCLVNIKELALNLKYRCPLLLTFDRFANGVAANDPFTQSCHVPSFRKEWGENPALSAVLVVCLVRARDTNNVFVGMSINTTTVGNQILRCAGGYASDKLPGDPDVWRSLFVPKNDFAHFVEPGNLAAYYEIQSANQIHAAAFSEVTEEVIGESCELDGFWFVGSNFQESYNDFCAYGHFLQLNSVASESQIAVLDGSEKDPEQGRTYWIPIGKRDPHLGQRLQTVATRGVHFGYASRDSSSSLAIIDAAQMLNDAEKGWNSLLNNTDGKLKERLKKLA